MKKIFTFVLAALIGLSFSVLGFAQQPAPTDQAGTEQPAKKAPAKKAKKAKKTKKAKKAPKTTEKAAPSTETAPAK